MSTENETTVDTRPKFGGRVAGTPNKATSKARDAIGLVAEGMAGCFQQWLLDTAQGLPARDAEGKVLEGKWINTPDPKGAADTYLKAIEYHIPKLARTETNHTGGITLTHEQFLDTLK